MGSSSPTGHAHGHGHSLSISRKSSNVRSSRESLRKQAVTGAASSSNVEQKKRVVSNSGAAEARPRMRYVPKLPHTESYPVAPTTGMYWSRASVFGETPGRPMKAHSATVVDNVVWVFGGCDETGCYRDVYCFDTETMHWSHPTMTGEIPPPCRAHTATLIDRKIVFIAGGQGPNYYDKTYILDTITRRWKLAQIEGVNPPPRRAHTAVLYKGQIWVFGGGNGMQALNDVWALDVAHGVEKLKWTKIDTHGKKPQERGYHTANLVGNHMVVIGGSDGRDTYQDIWFLNLDTALWTKAKLDKEYKRLSHTATQVGSYLFVLGGYEGSAFSPEMLLFNLVTLQWEHRAAYGKPPIQRGYHTTVLTDSRVFMIGGSHGGKDLIDDVQTLDLGGAAYLPQVMSFTLEMP
ncbi:galactose oxidase [Athelia psychrophila]|uniref:Galactose oxidase n=1 Tax=Athelia psychrophila TaxID=1759441 RepID=A0A165YRI9_9AGAM|nr:galactose oxidase [Fibularhizoctonia sp. CBS 109695]